MKEGQLLCSTQLRATLYCTIGQPSNHNRVQTTHLINDRKSSFIFLQQQQQTQCCHQILGRKSIFQEQIDTTYLSLGMPSLQCMYRMCIGKVSNQCIGIFQKTSEVIFLHNSIKKIKKLQAIPWLILQIIKVKISQLMLV